MVTDRHSAHLSKASRPFYDGFKVLLTPGYSSDLSAIETCWSHLKAKLAKHIDRMPRELTQIDFEAEVDLICFQINHEYDMRKMFYATREQLLKALED